jgi:stress response protein YsnF
VRGGSTDSNRATYKLLTYGSVSLVIHPEEELMNSPVADEVTEKSLALNSAVDSEVKDFEGESTKSAQTAHTKVGIDVERIRSSIARLTSNSTDELEKLSAELERLQEFLKSETGRVQREIASVMDGIGIIIEAIAPWKTGSLSNAQNTRTNGRDKLKRWP